MEFVDIEGDLSFEVCCGCLATDKRMIDLRQHSSDFTALLQLLPTSKVGLPARVCYECLAHLIRIKQFHAKNERAYNLLVEIVRLRGEVFEPDIREIDRAQHRLMSPLKHHKLEPISIDSPLLFNFEGKNGGILPNNIELSIKFEDNISGEDDIMNENDSLNVFNNFVDLKCKELKGEKKEVDNEEDQWKEAKRCKRTNSSKIKKRVTKTKKVKKLKESPEEVLDSKPLVQRVPKIVQRCPQRAPKTKRKPDPMKSYYTEEYQAFATLTVMTDEERIELFKQRSEKQQYKEAQYKCDDCFLGFLSFDAYETHCRKHEPSAGPLVCPVCRLRQKNERQHKKHIALNHRTKFQCKECPHVCSNSQRAKIHAGTHKAIIHRCEECDHTFKSETAHKMHMYMKHPEEIPCACCGVSYLGRGALRAHVSTAHPNLSKRQTMLACDCGVKFYSSEAKKLHLSTSSRHNNGGAMLLGCEVCDARFTDRKSVTAHMSMHRTPRADTINIPCEQCGEVMADSIAYCRHFRSAHPDKTRTHYPSLKKATMCDVCGKFFQCPTQLKMHMARHTGDKPFVCKHCGKTFAFSSVHRIHTISHTKERPFKCKVCGKGFSHPANRHRHQKVHTDVKLFACDVCGKTFKCCRTKMYHFQHVHMKKPWPKRDRSKRKLTSHPE